MDLHYWKRQSLNSLFDAGVTRNPMHTAIVFDDGQRPSGLTYAQLLSSSMTIADELRGSHKCRKEVIAVLIRTSLHLPTVLLGILGVPAAFYTLNVELPAPVRMKNIFERLGIRIVVTDSRECVDGLKTKIFGGCSLTVRHLNIMDHELLIVTLDDVSPLKNEGASSGSDLAYAITTSGTTGIPKIVKVPHRCIVPNILHLSYIYGLTGADTVLQASPLTFDPSIVEIFTTFFSGATLLMIPDALKLQPRSLASFAVERNKVTVLQATPSLVSSITSHGVLRSTLLSAKSSLRLLVFGGESCPNGRTLESWRQPGSRTRFINLYGITEVSSWATFYELTEEDIQSHIEDVPLGSTLLGTELEIRGIDDNSVGQLWIGGEDRICLIDDETQISGRHMRFSGDYVRRTHAGALLYVGRKDDMVKRNGRRLHLHEIEKVFSRAVGINSCIAVYERNKLILFVQPSSLNAPNQRDSSEKKTADENPQHSLNVVDSGLNSNAMNGKSMSDEDEESFSVARKAESDETKAEIEKQLLVAINELKDDWLPHFSRPDDVHFVWDLPLTNHGKVDKRQLIDMYGKFGKFIAPVPHLITEVEISDQLTRIWGKYITSDVPKTKSFVESGGNSVMAVAMTEDLHHLFGIDSASLLDIVLHGTLQNVINYVILAYQLTDKVTKVNNEHDSEDAIIPVDIISATTLKPDVPWVLPHPTYDLVNLEPRNLKRPMLSALPFGKQIRRDDVEYHSNDPPLESVLDHSTGNSSEEIDAVVLSIQRGSRTVYYEDFARSSMSSTECVGDVVEPPTLEMDVCWKFDTGKCVDASPLIVSLRNGENIIYIGSHYHRFVALNIVSGSAVWEVTLGDRIESSACLSHCARQVIVGCYDGKVYFLDRLTGRQHWSFQTGSQVKSSPCINAINGLVYIGSHDYHLYALSAELRSCVWKIDLGGASIYSSPLMNMLTYEVVVATLRGRLVSLHPDTGDMLWLFDAGKPMFSSVAYTDCHYVVGCVDGAVYCIGKDGEKECLFNSVGRFNEGNKKIHWFYSIWSYTTGGAVFSSPCISDVVFPKHATPQTSNAAYSCRLKPIAQSVVTSNPLPSTFVGRKIEVSLSNPQQFVETDSSENDPSKKMPRKIVTIGSHDCRVYCLCADNGGLLWSTALDSAIFSTPFPFGLQRSSVTLSISSHSEFTDFSSELRNFVAVCGSKGILYILDLTSGLVLGKFQFPGELFSSPCVVGDRLIVGCRDNFVYCIKLSVSFETS